MEAKTMSDNSRRIVCRLAFILLCAVPLGFVLYRICHPVTNLQWQQAIKADFGLTTRIGQVETPLPFVTVFRDVVLMDDSGLKPLAELDELQFIAGPTNEVQVAGPVQLDSTSLAKLSQRLRESLHRTHATSSAWNLTINEATLIRQGIGLQEFQTISPIQISVFPNPEFTDANIEFALADDSEQNQISLSLHSYRLPSNSHEIFRVNTGTAFLPCWLIEEVLPEVKSLGPLCEFSGFAELEQVKGKWAANFRQCQLESVELSSLAKPFAKSVGNVEGLARTNIRDCEIRDGKIQSLDLVLQSQNGTIDSTTADSANEIFDTQWTGEPSFDSMELQISFRDRKFHLTTPNAQGAIATLRNQTTLQLPRTAVVIPREMAGFLGYAKDPQDHPVNNATIKFLSAFELPQTRIAEESTVNTEFYR